MVRGRICEIRGLGEAVPEGGGGGASEATDQGQVWCSRSGGTGKITGNSGSGFADSCLGNAKQMQATLRSPLGGRMEATAREGGRCVNCLQCGCSVGGLLKGSYGVPQLEGKSGSGVAFLGRHNRKGVEEVLGTGEIT